MASDEKQAVVADTDQPNIIGDEEKTAVADSDQGEPVTGYTAKRHIKIWGIPELRLHSPFWQK